MNISTMTRCSLAFVALAAGAALGGCGTAPAPEATQPAETADRPAAAESSAALVSEGQQIFRFDTFGSEQFWGEQLQLHLAIAGERNGGVGPGVSPSMALKVGLKVDSEALPKALVEDLEKGKVDLDDPATTLALLKLGAVVGVQVVTDKNDDITSMGLTCAVCHSTVDDSFAAGIGMRRDGWANRDLDVGAIVSLAPKLNAFTDTLRVDEATVKKVLASWGPGCFDALLDKDGKALRPDGKRACTMIPPAFGLAGVNLHTSTGFGSVPYWNAYVAVTELRGSGNFYDVRLGTDQYPVSKRTGAFDTRVPADRDRVTAKLSALHFYQLAIGAPRPPSGSFDAAASARGATVFSSKAKCATCHVPPLYTEPGHNLHAPSEIGIDDFQSGRSPTLMYRTAPLAGLWSHSTGGFYHDGRFATLAEVVAHYDGHFQLGLTDAEKNDLVEYLKSL